MAPLLTNTNALLGQSLGTCTLQRLVGHGGMGAVYLAQQARPKREVAVKVLLQGPYDEAAALMGDALRSGGLLPVVEPYTALWSANALMGAIALLLFRRLLKN